MKSLFWICWSVEIAGALCWIVCEMKLQYVSPGPWSFLVALYLMVVLALRVGFDAHKTSVILVALPILPVVLPGLFFSHLPQREVASLKIES